MAIPAMVSTSDIPVIMTPAVLQRVMGLSKGKTYELIHRAGFPSLRVGKVIRIP